MSELEDLVPLTTPAQARAFENAKAAVCRDQGVEDMDNGAVVRHLAEAYTGWDGADDEGEDGDES